MTVRRHTHYYLNPRLGLLCLFSLPVVLLLSAVSHDPTPRSLDGQETSPAVTSARTMPLTPAQLGTACGRIELGFEANRGQTDPAVNFLARGASYTFFLRASEAVFVMSRPAGRGMGQAVRPVHTDRSETQVARVAGYAPHAGAAATPAVLRMKLVGANPHARVEGADELVGKSNYFIGDDPAKWRADVPTFARVHYKDVYPGVDVLYYGNQRQLEYDFVVAPGRDARAVRLAFEGADKVAVDAGGDLVLTVGDGVLRQRRPLVYQEEAGARRVIEGGYTIGADGHVGFALGEYDGRLALVIDPTLVYSTYLGGSGTDQGNDIAVDSAGSAYICGDTTSTNFPAANALDGTFAGGTFSGARDAFVTKLNPAGTALVYSTYLGGSGGGTDNGDDLCSKVKVDASGNAYVAGETHSADFPTANAFQGTYGGGFSDAFVTKLNAAGSALVYSTFIGGTIFDAAHALTIDSAGNAYVTGRTTSADFPTVNPIQGVYSGGPGADAFVTKINAAGSALVYSTYLGGSGGNGFTAGFSIAVDSSGNAYLTGQTRATNFPTANAIQGTFGGGFPDGDAFVTKLNAAGSALVYSTYLGGTDNDIGFEIAVDPAGSAHVVGSAFSNNFPVANAFQGTLSGTSDGFITKLNAAGSAFAYSTYLGGTGGDSSNGIALDSAGSTYVALGTTSTDFPTVNPTQGTSGGGGVDGAVAKFNAAGSALLFSTYLGGNGSDAALGIALDSAGSMYITGRTSSTNFPTLTPVQGTNGGGQDAFITKISDPPAALVQFSSSTYGAVEDCTFTTITLNRTGNLSSETTVDFVTSDGTAIQRTDYTLVAGVVRFAVGETSKTFRVLISEDAYVEGNESINLILSDPAGGGLGTPATATFTITDDDTVNPPIVNPIDDANIFVRQHYHDYLAREGDSGGTTFWTTTITDCGANQACINSKRIDVSNAFYYELEFQQTGSYVYRVYRAAFGNDQPFPNPIPDPAHPGEEKKVPLYTPFMRDRARVRGGPTLPQLQLDFASAFVQRPEFLSKYPASLATASQFVDAVLATLTSDIPVNLSGQRQALIDLYGQGSTATAGRANVLYRLAEDNTQTNPINNRAFVDAEYNRAFVFTQYAGYLRRNADMAGFLFWLGQVNGAPLRDVPKQHAMVCSFITAVEYQERFSSLVTHSNTECQ